MLLRNLLLFPMVGIVDAATIQPRSQVAAPAPAPAQAVTAYNKITRWSFGRRLWNVVFPSDSKTLEAEVYPKKLNHHLVRYQNDIVLRFNISSSEEARSMAEAVSSLYLDVWSTTKKHVDVRLPQGTVPLLLDLLPESLHRSHSPMMHSVVDTALESYPGVVESPLPHGRQESTLKIDADILFFQDYQPLSVIAPWMKLLQSMFPSFVEIINVGKSYEGRDIHAFKIGKPHTWAKKRAVVITGAAHAREWISVSTVCYMAYAMITSYGKDDKGINSMVDELDWIFIPTLNVDGYVYTWENDRLWRKNRQPTSLSFCKGIDLDRAYDFHFDNSPQSSSNPCSDMFPGGYAFEAAESRAFSEWASNYTSDGTQILGLLDFHSYSQQILYPFSYSCNDRPPDLENLEELAIGLAKAIRLQSGEHYEVSSACEGTGFAGFPGTTGSGSMLDYLYAVDRVPYTYQIKLRDTGSYGFLLPKDNIIPTGEEIFNLIKYFSQFVLDDGSPTVSTSDEL